MTLFQAADSDPIDHASGVRASGLDESSAKISGTLTVQPIAKQIMKVHESIPFITISINLNQYQSENNKSVNRGQMPPQH